MLVRTLPSLVLVGLGASCVVVQSDSRTHYSGRYVSESTLAQVTPGKTQDFVLAVIGEPSSRTTLDDGGEIWKWAHTKREDSSGHLILVFSGGRSVEVEGATYVEFTPDKLVRHTWRD